MAQSPSSVVIVSPALLGLAGMWAWLSVSHMSVCDDFYKSTGLTPSKLLRGYHYAVVQDGWLVSKFICG